MKIDLIQREIAQKSRISLLSFSFPIFAIVLALAVGGALGILGSYALVVVLGVLILTSLLLLHQDELAIGAVIAVQIFVDWYLGFHIVSLLIALVLLSIFYLSRSPQHPLTIPHALWLWVLFLILPIPAVIRGDHDLYDLAFYYPNIFFGALVFFWLGMLVARRKKRLKTLFQALAALGSLLAILTIIQATTGKVVFGTSSLDVYLSQVSNFGLAKSGVNRIGSYFYNPDWNGAFFAMMLFLPLGLFTEVNSLPQKFLYFTEMLLMLIALLFTYAFGAWIGVLGGMVALILFAGRSNYRILIPVLMVIMGVTSVMILPNQVNLLFQHASNPSELTLRLGAWQTALNIIRAFPIMGIGLGFTNYAQRAESYRVPAQYISLAHPHNSYLELGSMAGLPVLIVFLALLLLALLHAWRNWIQVDKSVRCLIGGGIATIVALSIDSVSVNGWTLPPLAAIGWLILGTISSLLITREQSHEGALRENP